jgi:hypothetical protein
VTNRTVTQVCEDSLDHPALLKGCNLFVQSVCAEFGYGDIFTKGDNADAMIKKFDSPPFHYIGKDPDKATKVANEGHLVLGGLSLAAMLLVPLKNKPNAKKPTMGHVVVVAPGGPCKQENYILTTGAEQPAAAGYPYCYGGAAREEYRLKQRVSVSLVFPRASRDNVIYAYLEIPKKK